MTVDYSERANPRFRCRSFDITDFEIRSSDDGDSDTLTFEGIACTVGQPYNVRDSLGEYVETIAEGAFKRTLSDPGARIELRWQHDPRREPYAVFDPTTRTRTLELIADPHLRVRATLDKSRPDVQNLRSLIQRREATQMSIGFNDVKGGDAWTNNWSERTVNDMRLMETSIVGRGANDLTAASLRSLVRGDTEMTGDLDPAEVRQMFAYLQRLLPDVASVADAGEAVERSGLVIDDAFIALQRMRFARR